MSTPDFLSGVKHRVGGHFGIDTRKDIPICTREAVSRVSLDLPHHFYNALLKKRDEKARVSFLRPAQGVKQYCPY